MLKQYVPQASADLAFHQPGEVVLADYGNFLEAGMSCDRKTRPVILLRTSDCQHMFAGLTTKSCYLTTGGERPLLPRSPSTGLNARPSHLWSSRPAFVSRLDIRRHLGWVDHEIVEFLAKHMNLDAITIGMLWRSASIHTCGLPRNPR